MIFLAIIKTSFLEKCYGLSELGKFGGAQIGFGLHVLASCPNPGSRLLDVTVYASQRDSGPIEFTFPRWVPGSYLIREPFRYVREIIVEDERGNPLKWRRTGINGIVVGARSPSSAVVISYQVVCPELSVRSNHLDSSHLHLMPPFTWFLPKSGCQWAVKGGPVSITLHLPKGWSPATQQQLLNDRQKMPKHDNWKAPEGCETYTFEAINRDELLDGVFEANENPTYSRDVCGITHHLKLWDAGTNKIDESSADRILDAISKIAKECYDLFGIPNIQDYTVILHFTGGMRGGLEHMRSQTSMVPRKSLWVDAKDEWRDLVSLLSHEYVHLWNVKDLRPKKFLDYDLDSEQMTDLLWWFEGGTSWLGDVICVRSGVWNEEDYRIEFKKKLERHLKGNGHESQSLAESSHEAWLHLYRTHPYSSESQISYYNDSEIALFCLDAEMRRRSGGFGLEQLYVELYNKHGLHSSEPGVDEASIKLALGRCKGGARLGGYLDELIHSRTRPPIEKALERFGLTLSSDEKETDEKLSEIGWLGLNLVERGNNLIVTKVVPDSPLRDLAMPDDEMIAVDEIRIKTKKSLKSILKGKVGQQLKIVISRHDSLIELTTTPTNTPIHKAKLEGRGNRLWKHLTSSQPIEN